MDSSYRIIALESTDIFCLIKCTKCNNVLIIHIFFKILCIFKNSDLTTRKLSKIETLRLASSYISHLGNVLLLGEGLHDGQPCHAPSPPFFHVNSSPTRGSDQSAQPKHICTFCLSNQRKMVSKIRNQSKLPEKRAIHSKVCSERLLLAVINS